MTIDQKDFLELNPFLFIAKVLFGTDGVKSVFFGRDFVTITKETVIPWHLLQPQIYANLLDFIAEGKAVILESVSEAVSDTTILETDDEVVATIKELIETRVRPAVQEDGGDIYYEVIKPIIFKQSILTLSCRVSTKSQGLSKFGLQDHVWDAHLRLSHCEMEWRTC